MKSILMVIPMLILTSCFHDSEGRYDSGYSDGYASGYNTTCKIRATIIEGDWDDQDYTNGYQQGYSAGSYDCTNSR
jgi:hypothetical protein